MRHKSVPVILTKGAVQIRFRTMADAALHLNVSRTAVSRALKIGNVIDGWQIDRDGEGDFTEAQKFEFRRASEYLGDVRVKEIFTRKPFEATGIWRPKDECME